MSMEIVETKPEERKRIYQFIGFNDDEFRKLTESQGFSNSKALMINDKFNIQVEVHGSIEIIKLRKHKPMEYEI